MDSVAKYGAQSPTLRRILREARELEQSPSPDYTAAPLEDDLFQWHFTLRGPPNSAYSEGIYHGRIVLPPSYPLRPPSFRFLTPSGRFQTNREICLSISGHHEETWQPAWGMRTALVALRSFMETSGQGQIGGIQAPDAARRQFAAESRSFRCATCGQTNADILRASEEAARHKEAPPPTSDQQPQPQLGQTADGPTEDQVPPELRLAYREDLQPPTGTADTGNGGNSSAPSEPTHPESQRNRSPQRQGPPKPPSQRSPSRSPSPRKQADKRKESVEALRKSLYGVPRTVLLRDDGTLRARSSSRSSTHSSRSTHSTQSPRQRSHARPTQTDANADVDVDEIQETALLAEGFLSTATTATTSLVHPNDDNDGDDDDAAAATPVSPYWDDYPSPTMPAEQRDTGRGDPVLEERQRQQQRQRQRQRMAHDGVPMWIDNAILAFALLLIALVVKVFLGY